MDNIELKTPGGYTVTIKPELSYGQFIQLQHIFADTMKYNPETKLPVNSELEGKALLESQAKAMEFLVVKILDPQGNEVTNIAGALESLTQSDGQMISDKVNEIWGKAQLPKKRGFNNCRNFQGLLHG